MLAGATDVWIRQETPRASRSVLPAISNNRSLVILINRSLFDSHVHNRHHVTRT